MLSLPPQLGHDSVMKSPRGAWGSVGMGGGAAGTCATAEGTPGTEVDGNLLPQERQNAASMVLGVPQDGQYF